LQFDSLSLFPYLNLKKKKKNEEQKKTYSF